MEQERKLTGQESIELITQMINKARNAYYDTGIAAIMWGSVVAFCALEKFAEFQFDYRLPFDIYLLTLAAIIPQIFITIKEKKGRAVKSYDDPYMDYIWLGFGICIALMIFIVNVIFRVWNPVADEYTVLTGHQPAFQFYEFIAPLFLILYGLPTFITGTACKFRPMLWGGLLCWACCVITVFTTIKIDLLLTALSSIGAWLIPGLILEKKYKKAKKQLREANV